MSAYLATLDRLLADGVTRLPRPFVARQVRFIERRQGADGGFPGRQGGADLYYTDFALRVLTLCAPDSPAVPRAARYLAACPAPTDLVHVCAALHSRRLLRRCGYHVGRDVPGVLPPFPPLDSAYRIFLAALCCALRGEPFPHQETAVRRLRALRGGDGGFAGQPGEACGQTNATAAALGALALWARLGEEDTAATVFLAGMQAEDGGLRAHAALAAGDLLSTFTGLLTLATLGDMAALRLGEVGRFTRGLACPDGGFRGAPGDAEADSEYTFYGLGTLALLALCLA
ncbi:MAG TPA: prenyltransferase/squalene oxidase repeat-containing protein [Armatimonadota bacterium]|nr:prenyltransferase/squalene oxidase repeat-containing protein [Armatimonadota bacterium]HOS43280.1 prenyltransferase/squalene oxidase repeat-containing protein [Armatimonadota bacterium]